MTVKTRARRPAEADIAARLRAYSMGDWDTHAALRRNGEWIADVPLIRDARDLVDALHEAASEIERLRAEMEPPTE